VFPFTIITFDPGDQSSFKIKMIFEYSVQIKSPVYRQNESGYYFPDPPPPAKGEVSKPDGLVNTATPARVHGCSPSMYLDQPH